MYMCVYIYIYNLWGGVSLRGAVPLALSLIPTALNIELIVENGYLASWVPGPPGKTPISELHGF